MPFVLLIINLTQPVLLIQDSTLYAADPNQRKVISVQWPEEIIDQVYDNDIYLLTRRFLWRLDPTTLTVLDRVLLPQRFNYLTTREQEIVLIAAEEVITMDKRTLGFKSGMGIERGDNQPLIAPGELAAAGRSNLLYLASDAGTGSIIRVFNLNDGRLVMKKSLPRILDFNYDARRFCLQVLDAEGRLSDYGLNLKKIRSINLPAASISFEPQDAGYILFQPEAVVLVNSEGAVLDFQPLPLRRAQSQSWFGYEGGIGQLDLAVIRVRRLYPLPEPVTRCHAANQTLGLALTAGGKSMRLDPDTAGLELSAPASSPPFIKNLFLPESANSLWYFQLGAFTAKENAGKALSEYRAAGLPVHLDSADLYRVQLGAFVDKNLGLKLAQEFNLKGWFVLRPRVSSSDTGSFIVRGEAYEIKNGIIQTKGVNHEKDHHY